MRNPTVIPYISVVEAEQVAAFIQQVFGAEGGMLGTGSQGGMHGQFVIGDAMVMIGGGPAWRDPKPSVAALHVYVDDADAAYRRAIEAGAKSLYEPSDKPYGDREAAVQDLAGNQWFIGTPRGRTRPEGTHDVNVTFLVHGAADFLEFLGRAFAAEIVERHPPEGPVVHAEVRIGDCIVEVGEAHGQWQPIPTAIFLTVGDCDSAYQRAVSAGGEAVMPPTNMPYGLRSGNVRDAAGNLWNISGPLRK
jgi:uncharacterized glyoxalase superfamily protein PhnB